MCFECGIEAKCLFCGTNCQGTCGDPDSCRTCWRGPASCPVAYEGSFEEWDDCEDSDCPCTCHSQHDYMATGSVNSVEMEKSDTVESGVQYEPTNGGIIESEDRSRLLTLSSEVKNMIYEEVLRQEGDVRTSPYFRGKIHTAILYTCREAYLAAAEILIRQTKFWFTTASAGLDFFGFLTNYHLTLVKECHFDLSLVHRAGEFHVQDLVHDSHLKRFLEQLANHQFIAVGVTIMGPVPKYWFYTDFLTMFQPIMGMKSLQHLGINIGSLLISNNEKGTIIGLLKAMFMVSAPGLGNNSSVLPADLAYLHAAPWIRAIPDVRRVAQWIQTLPQDIIDSAPIFKEIMEHDKLLQHWERLEEHAKLTEEGYSTVRIRIPQARVLAEQGCTAKYYELVAGIKKTLDEYYQYQFEVQKKVREAYEAYAADRQNE